MVSNYNKKDLEIIYKIQWKNLPGHGDDKANIVGMYDIPATTLNWETFKSYLLKNSGATVDDVKVYYVCDDKEFCIQSQLDFQLALYSFRQKARTGDIINLRLDRISDQSTMGRIKRLRRSAEPRLEEEHVAQVVENNVNSAATLPVQSDNPPEWFKKFMKGFKKEIVEEVTTSVINNLSTTVQNSTPSYYHPSRKTKMDYSKRPRKISVIIGKPENDHRTLLKSLKMERKLDCKLEKLELKTMKLKEKKMALLRSSDDENRNNSTTVSTKTRPIGVPLSDTELLMDASPIGQHELIIPRMSGGETYHQEWHIINTGDLQWTENTELRYAWGSEALKPLDKSVPCPPLNPGDKGIVSVYLEIPKKAGDYESYWHFYHEGRRFGHWLGCRVIVEPPPAKILTPIDILTSDNDQSMLLHNWTSTPKKMDQTKEKKEFAPANIDDEDLKKFCSLSMGKELTEDDLKINEINDVSAGLEDLKLYDSITVHDSNSSSDSDNQSIISIADSNSSGHSPSDEFVVVPIMSECLNSEEKINVEGKSLGSGNMCIPLCSDIKLEKIDNSTNENNDDQKDKAKTDEANEKEIQIDNELLGYAFVNVHGNKIAVPKYLLRSDYLATAEEAPTPDTGMLNMIPPNASSPTPTIDSLAPTINTSTTPSIILPKEGNDKDIIILHDCAIGNAEESHVLNENIQHESISSTIKDGIIENEYDSGITASRLFMFPSNIPGFEVFPTPKSFTGSLPPESNISCNATNQSSNIFNETIPSSSHPSGQFYQYGYCPSPMTTSSTAENIFGYSYTYPHSHFRVPPHLNAWYTPPQHIPPLPPLENPTPIYNKYAGAAPTGRVDFRTVPNNCADHTYTLPAAVAFEAENSPPASDSHDVSSAGTMASSPVHSGIPLRSAPVAILPNTLVSGAVNVASSAINTARSVINMFSPPAARQQEPEQWESNAWTTTNTTTTATTTTVEQDSPREKALRTLYEMGFWDRNLNSTLLARYNNDLTRVISELVN